MQATAQFLFYLHILSMITAVAVIYIGASKAILKKSNDWVKSHKKFMLTAVLIALIGFSCEVTFKFLNGYPHFNSAHSQIGLFSIILWIILPVIGLMIMKGKKQLGFMHRIYGYIAILTGSTTVVLGVIIFIKFILAQQGQ